jgi:hypothetical protein
MNTKSLNIMAYNTFRILSVLNLITLLSIARPVDAQQDKVKTSALYPGFGIGLGIFYPGDVNEYIESHMPGNILSQTGSTDLFMYEEIHAFLTYRIKWIDITSIVEYAFGPKWIIITNSTNQFYSFNRFSPGLLVNFYIPTGSGRHAIYLGGGAQYHFMKFEEYKGGNIGLRVNAGYSIQFGKLNLQPYLAFNLAKAKDTETLEFNAFELNYTGGQIGLNLSFHKPIAYR